MSNIIIKDNNDNEQQLLTHYPDDNLKQIDYIIKFKPPKRIEVQYRIEAFFKEIISHQIQVKYLNVRNIKNENNDDFTYALLHCPLERLLIEAETIKLEMDLKKVYFF
jgi:hypothetical protein